MHDLFSEERRQYFDDYFAVFIYFLCDGNSTFYGKFRWFLPSFSYFVCLLLLLLTFLKKTKKIDCALSLHKIPDTLQLKSSDPLYSL